VKKVLFTLLLISVIAVVSMGTWTIAVSAAAIHHEFSLMANQGARDTLEKAGVNVIFTEAGGDELQQVAHIENAVQRKVDGIIIHGITAEALKGAIVTAEKAGIPVVAIDVPLTGPNVVSVVSSDNYAAGLMMARYLIGRLGGKGNIVAMYTPGIPVLDQRYTMLRTVLNDYPDIKIVAELPWRAPAYVQSSLDEMERFLRANPQVGAVDAVWSAADMPAIGAATAIERAGRQNEMFIVSMDALPEALEFIKNGPHFACTVAQQPYEMGIAAANAMLDYLAGKPPIRWVFVPFTLVTQENVSAFIEE
jgi:ribose transport system substrate-binding protein